MRVITEILSLSGIENSFMFSGLAGFFPSFEGENANLFRLGFIMVIMIFALGLARIIFRRKENDREEG